MHKLKIIKKEDSYHSIYLDDKIIEGIVSLNLKITTHDYDKVVLELVISELEINVPLEEIEIKSEKDKRFQLLDFEK